MKKRLIQAACIIGVIFAIGLGLFMMKLAINILIELTAEISTLETETYE